MMTVVHAFTSAARNYLPKARLLLDSVRRFHPGWRIHLALADEEPDGADPSSWGFDEVHPVARMEIPGVRAWAFGHTLVELSTAIKPVVLRDLLRRSDCRGVVYLDPDTVLFSPLEEVERSLDTASVVLTPHLTEPDVESASNPANEMSALQHGTYNLGFVGVRACASGLRFADWWMRRCLRYCRNDIPNGLFTDQRWIDLVPGLFPDVRILRGSRLNVAPWNIATRKVTGTVPDGLLVDGEPLGFYHFTGFDSGAHRTMAVKYASDQPAVARLIEWYAAMTGALAAEPALAAPWAYGTFSDGSMIPLGARTAYRDSEALQRRFKDPFDARGFKVWWECHGAQEPKQGPGNGPRMLRQLIRRAKHALTRRPATR
jgi:hypothetical protein